MRNDLDDCCGLGVGRTGGETRTMDRAGCHSEQTALERVRYFPRQLLTVEEMETECDYFRQKLRRHNRFVHGWGVVCGLEVTFVGTADTPFLVKIGSGYALGPYGDEIFVGEPVLFDLARCGPDAATDPCEPTLVRGGSGIGDTVYVAIKYAECLARPVRAMPAGCACDDEDCEYSRIRDSFQISCLPELPAEPDVPELCAVLGKPVPCPPCPSDPWVVLVKVTLPVSETALLSGGKMEIDYGVRRQIFSTAILQKQLIECCCEERPEPEPKPVPELLKVVNVRVLAVRGREELVAFDAKGKSFSQPAEVDAIEPNTIEVRFNRPADVNTINTATFTVSAAGGLLKSKVVFVDDRTVRWQGNRPFRFGVVHTVTLSDAITSQKGVHLDGDAPGQLPSGDGTEGGAFAFTFNSIPVIG